MSWKAYLVFILSLLLVFIMANEGAVSKSIHVRRIATLKEVRSFTIGPSNCILPSRSPSVKLP